VFSKKIEMIFFERNIATIERASIYYKMASSAVVKVKSAARLRRLVSSSLNSKYSEPKYNLSHDRDNDNDDYGNSSSTAAAAAAVADTDDCNFLEEISLRYGIHSGAGEEVIEMDDEYFENTDFSISNEFDEEEDEEAGTTVLEQVVGPPQPPSRKNNNPKLSPILTSSKNFDEILAQHRSELHILREQFNQVQQDHKNEISTLKAQLKNTQEELKEKQYESCLVEEIQTLENRIAEIKLIKDSSLKSELFKELKLSERHLASARQDLTEIKESQKLKAEEKKQEAQLHYEIQTLEKQISGMRPSSANSFQQSISPQLKFKQRLLARAKQQLVEIKNKRNEM
jgi:hypothetical protein